MPPTKPTIKGISIKKTTFQFMSLNEHNQYLASNDFFLQVPTTTLDWPLNAPNEYSLAAYQTPIRSQGDRGTCYAFAGIAALEAAYKRKYGSVPDLSPQYLFHINKCFEMYQDYMDLSKSEWFKDYKDVLNFHENNCSAGGGQGGADIVYKLSRAAMPEQRLAPYLSGSQINAIVRSLPEAGDLNKEPVTQERYDLFEFDRQNIPTDARNNCRYKVKSFLKVNHPSTGIAEHIIASKKELVVDCDWFKLKYNSNTGIHEFDPQSSGGGAHCFVIIGYNRPQQYFLVKNSHGGDDFIKISYEYFNKVITGDCYFITDVEDINIPPQMEAKFIGVWNMNHDGHLGKLVIRRFTDYHRGQMNTPFKVGNYYRDGKRYDVNGSFADNGRRLVCYIADHEGKIQPGTLNSGQRFDIMNFSWQPETMAGATIWNNTPYGVYLSRSAITNVVYTTPFTKEKWLGSWNMNHDGWKGTLAITSFNVNRTGNILITGTYRRADTGATLAISGTINSLHPHIMDLIIPFSNSNKQVFQLLFHTWQDGFFSGTTVWNNSKFGVMASLF